MVKFVWDFLLLDFLEVQFWIAVEPVSNLTNEEEFQGEGHRCWVANPQRRDVQDEVFSKIEIKNVDKSNKKSSDHF